MKKSKPYAELVTQAEEATKAIRDPELRRVAFERVLDDLLAGGNALNNGISTQKTKGNGTTKYRGKTKVSKGPKGYIRELINDGFFKKPKTITEVKAELANRGHHIARTSLSGPLQKLCQERVLRRHKAKKGDKSNKATFNYSEW
ncbi:MAG: hypothetical protein JW746_05845 [Candidatus Krumholzibacteriota bacterium]|nr:hypothetical protein [Candidatus Krumholzibacteriota bacterium]